MLYCKNGNMKQKGFTLIELLVVVSVIGLMASIVLVSLNTARQKARNARRLADAHQIVNALHLYLADSQGMVGCGAVISIGTDFDTGQCLPTALSSYMSRLPRDPINDAGAQYIYYICTEGSACNTQFAEGRHFIRINLEPTQANQYFFIK